MAGAVRGGAVARRARAHSAGDACSRRPAHCGGHRTIGDAERGRRASRPRAVALPRPGRACRAYGPGSDRGDAGCGPCAAARAGAAVMAKMVFIERDGTAREVEAPIGASVLELAHHKGIDIEGACEGSLACSTCHVIVDPEWYDLLIEASEDEEDMLDLAANLTATSRLGCQIVITEELDGLTVRLPAARRNLLLG